VENLLDDSSREGKAPSRRPNPEFVDLTERLAKTAHETWARLRVQEGWRFGAERNDRRKEHPGLVPFEELSEDEKNYDRQMVRGTLEELLALGHQIEPQGRARPASVDGRSRGAQARRELREALADCRAGHTLLHKLWRERQEKGLEEAAWNYESLAERILEIGEPLFAYDVAAEGVREFPENTRLRQLLALALARSGASGAANALLSELYRTGHRDEETLGLLARTHRDLAAEECDAERARRRLEKARRLYEAAYRASRGYWTGINAATLAELLGKRQEARSLAAEVAEECRRRLQERSEAATEERYWILSTLGEAALLEGRTSEAEQWYGEAVELARGDWGSLRSTRHNARLIHQSLGGGADFIERVFRFPRVAVFTGHRVDEAGRSTPRFPMALEEAVKGEIQKRLEGLNVSFGYASAANGSDILFLEALSERNGEIHVVLPYERDHFLRDSVELPGQAGWGRRYEQVLSKAVEVLEASRRSQMCGKVSYEFADLVLHGLASVHAQQLEVMLVPMAVWDGRKGDGPDGTAGTVERWRGAGLDVEVIDIGRMSGEPAQTGGSPIVTTEKGAPPEIGREFAAEIRAMLFADAQGFSRLSDEEVPRFVEHFLGLVAELIEETPYPPLTKNTWGDGLYFVFESVAGAGQFALELRDRVAATNWKELGLPNLNLRIGLHAGPVYACRDPVTLRRNYIGAHVSRAARIEPVTPPGQVYASQTFAALAAAQSAEGFTCTYVGQTEMAKQYGCLPTYVVLRRNACAG
jgi:class 3 adenylate cyclase/tetratricopeptide (TPR) repeat protein